jgi:hypothetical protein
MSIGGTLSNQSIQCVISLVAAMVGVILLAFSERVIKGREKIPVPLLLPSSLHRLALQFAAALMVIGGFGGFVVNGIYLLREWLNR